MTKNTISAGNIKKEVEMRKNELAKHKFNGIDHLKYFGSANIKNFLGPTSSLIRP